MSATVLGMVFLMGFAASGAVAYLRRGTLLGSIGAATAVACALLAVLAFIL